MCTYAIGNASWKNGFDDDAGATSADDAESKTAAIVDEIYHFNLSPFRIQLRTEKHFKVPALRYEALIILSNVTSPKRSGDIMETKLPDERDPTKFILRLNNKSGRNYEKQNENPFPPL